MPKNLKAAAKPRTPATPNNPKISLKPNASILNFFKKVEHAEQGLFVEGKALNGLVDNDPYDTLRESWAESTPPKRRKLSGSSGGAHNGEVKHLGRECTPPPPETLLNDGTSSQLDVTGVRTNKASAQKGGRRNGPFLDDSDSDQEFEVRYDETNGDNRADTQPLRPQKMEPEDGEDEAGLPISSGDFEGFEGLEDFEENEFGQGEEFEERRWMERQQMLEMAEENLEGDDDALLARELQIMESRRTLDSRQTESTALCCPICNTPLQTLTDHEASIHVNSCLDGPTCTTGSSVEHPESLTIPITTETQGSSRPAKPGQKDPFATKSSSIMHTSAFSRLMTKQSEDTAWATAAAAEVSSRGKPAYTRTCPFYKILPGLSICVDAFRYGAVAGCQAYFLSHFHSDHYIGLTSSWCHGPIYCSRVTANLVRAQLRVDPKWIVGIDFEEEMEVPDTDGVRVTMIFANHCPGSSLFLFEKVTGKGRNPKTQRVLHCGDFRACREHLEHPLLRPEVLDAVSGKTRQQRIDVCYLDTTYLNPKYAFPEQDAVIKACAEMCVNMSEDAAKGLEHAKADPSEGNMKKFLQNGESPAKSDTSMPSLSKKGRLLIIVGTYSIGKERLCLGIARALNSKIYAPPAKQKICSSLEDTELTSRLTTDPRAAQVHMTPLFEIRAETLDDYLRDYRDTFTRAVGFRPTGWNYRPPNSRFVESPPVQTVLHGPNWRSGYTVKDMVPQRGSSRSATCFGVPYSEHSSFRELTMFCCALRIDRVIPTVNVGSAKSREMMRTWVERWNAEKKKNGLFKARDF
jgi:DNA cross-link repair 1A protein